MREHKDLLSKWLRVLFYAQIASMAMTAVNAVSRLDTITGWLSKALSAVVIWSLFQLKDVHPRYRTAAIAKAVVLICGVITLPVNTSGLGPSTVLLLVGSTASWIAAYQQYHAHGELVEETDPKLGKRWKNLFVWEIVIGLCISFFSTAATVALVSAEMDSNTVTTIVLAVTNVVYLLVDALYLLYMKQTLQLIEA